MAIGHPAYYDNTPETTTSAANFPFANNEEYSNLLHYHQQIKAIPLKADYMEAPRGKFAVAAFNPLVTGHHHNPYFGAMYDELEVEDVSKRDNWAYLAIREDFWPVSNKQIVIPPAQPVTPDIYRQTLAQATSPSLAGSAPTQGVYTGLGGANTSGHNQYGSGYGYEP